MIKPLDLLMSVALGVKIDLLLFALSLIRLTSHFCPDFWFPDYYLQAPSCP